MFLDKIKKQKSGFTLVELLIIIAIIGIISTAAATSLNRAKAKARDARRLSDIAQIRKALDIYNYLIADDYPAENGDCTGLVAVAGVDGCISAWGNTTWIPDLDTPIPSDPLNITVNPGKADQVHYYYLYQKISGFPNNHYILQYNLETQPRIDECNGQGYSGVFSCVSGGDITP